MTEPHRHARWSEAAQLWEVAKSQGAQAGVLTPASVAHLTGLQALQQMMAGALPYPSVADAAGIFLVEVAAGRAVFQGTPSAAFLNPMGSLHGGWYATLLDSALGCAVHTTMPVGRAYTTAELSVNLVRAIPLDGRPVRATGLVLHAGRQLATAEGRLVDEEGKLYAHATTTCLVFDMPQAKPAG